MKAFWLDRDTDRFRVLVHDRQRHLDETVGDISPVRFAGLAWTLATPPSLVPGWVRWHRRVLSAVCWRNEFDGGLSTRVELVAPLPGPLSASRAWWQDRGWRGWPELFGQYVQPAAAELSRHPHVRTTLLVEGPLPLDDLPTPTEPRHVAVAAERAVTVVVRHLNDLVGPVLAQLDSDQPDRTNR